MSVLAIDQGTSSTRALRLDDDGRCELVHVVEHKQHFPQPGWVEHDPEELLQNIRDCIERAGDVDAIGIDNQGESCLAWDADSGEAVSPVIVWQDNRSQRAIEALMADGAEEYTLAAAGLPLDAYFSAGKLAWTIDNIPRAKSLLEKGRLRLGTTDAYFLDRLTGRFVTDITTASRTSLMNLETGCWDEKLCAMYRVPMEALPEIVPTVGDFGTINVNGNQVPVTASVVDQQASLYGHGCRTVGDAKITFGTGAFALALTGDQLCRAPEKGLLPTVAWQSGNNSPEYALDGAVYCASSALNWARSLGLFDDFSELNQFEKESAIARDLVFVPALSGLACPHWDRRAAGMWLGLSLQTDKRDMVQAIIEGVALRAAEVLGAMNDYVAIDDSISIDGGMSVNPYFCQFLADVLERSVTVQQSAELTAQGTAVLASSAGTAIAISEAEKVAYHPRGRRSALCEKFSDAVSRTRSWRDASLQ